MAAQKRKPHNELFLFAFDDVEVARVELQAALPPTLLARLDIEGLMVEPNRLVEDDLSARFCDVLYRVPLRSGGKAIVWVLLEHQSSDDAMMGLRLLEYMVRVWSKLRRAARPKAVALPVIVPIVLQHDPAGWKTSQQFSALYDGGAALLEDVRGLVPDFTYILDDLTDTTDEALAARTEGSPFLRLVLWSLRSNGQVDPARKGSWIKEMRALAQAQKYDEALAVVRYHMSMSEADEPVALQAAREADPDLERSCMTFLEKIEARGEAKGEVKTLLKLITLKFGAPSDEVVARVEAASQADLDRWVGRILTASSLDELFAA